MGHIQADRAPIFARAHFANSFFVITSESRAVPIRAYLVLKRKGECIFFARRTRLGGGRVLMDGRLAGDGKVVDRKFLIGINAVPGICGRLLMRCEVGNGVVQDDVPLETTLCIKHHPFGPIRKSGSSFGSDSRTDGDVNHPCA